MLSDRATQAEAAEAWQRFMHSTNPSTCHAATEAWQWLTDRVADRESQPTEVKLPEVYAVSVNVTRHAGGVHWLVQHPTVYLLARVQGITCEAHAERIVRESFVRLGHAPEDVSITVAATSAEAML